MASQKQRTLFECLQLQQRALFDDEDHPSSSPAPPEPRGIIVGQQLMEVEVAVPVSTLMKKILTQLQLIKPITSLSIILLDQHLLLLIHR